MIVGTENPNRKWIGKVQIYLNEIDSTNKYAKRFPAKMLSHGMVILAEHQTKGIGTNQRKWFSSQQDITCTIVVEQSHFLACNEGTLTTRNRLQHGLRQATVLAVAEAVHQSTGLTFSITNNDIYKNGLKAGGVLVESFQRTGNMWYAIGIGLNVNSQVADFPRHLRRRVTTLRDTVNIHLDKYKLFSHILVNLDHRLDRLVTLGFESVNIESATWQGISLSTE